MDPQQRLLLETASVALLARPREAAYEALRANWGVFVVSGGGAAGVVLGAAASARACLPWPSPLPLHFSSNCRASPPTTTTVSCPST